MSGKCRPSLRKKTLYKVERCDLSNTDKDCIKAVFELAEKQQAKMDRLTEENKNLKAKIKTLQKDINDIDDFARNICKERLLQGKAIADFDSLRKYVKIQRAEAVEEFADRLKAHFAEAYTPAFCKTLENQINDILNEMDGE